MLQPCTSLWGKAEIRDELPRIEVFEDVVYLPYKHRGAWGLFDADRKVIEPSVDRCRDGETPNQKTEWPAEIGAVDDTAPADEYLYLGCMNLHYGHFIINTLARYWSLPVDRPPGLPLLCHGPGRTADWRRFKPVARVLSNLGLQVEELSTFDRPMRIRRVVVPHTSLREQAYAHRIFGKLCRRIGSPLLADHVPQIDARPIYLSKLKMKSGVGRFLQEDVFTDTFAKAGFDIVFPEELTFKEQLRLFASRPVVAGTMTSAFHTSIFSRPGCRIVGLSPIPQVNSNFALIDKLNGNKASYFYAPGTTYSNGGGFLTSASVSDGRGAADALVTLARRSPPCVEMPDTQSPD